MSLPPPLQNKEREKVTQYTQRNKAFFAKSHKKQERSVCYNFDDPILNREFRETATRHN